jgi:hypothetical protein
VVENCEDRYDLMSVMGRGKAERYRLHGGFTAYFINEFSYVRVMSAGLDRSDLMSVMGWGKAERGRLHGGFTLGIQTLLFIYLNSVIH